MVADSHKGLDFVKDTRRNYNTNNQVSRRQTMAPEPGKRKTRNASAKDKKAETAKAADDIGIVIRRKLSNLVMNTPLSSGRTYA